MDCGRSQLRLAVPSGDRKDSTILNKTRCSAVQVRSEDLTELSQELFGSHFLLEINANWSQHHSVKPTFTASPRLYSGSLNFFISYETNNSKKYRLFYPSLNAGITHLCTHSLWAMNCISSNAQNSYANVINTSLSGWFASWKIFFEKQELLIAILALESSIYSYISFSNW